MQDRYVGDAGDYAKYALLKALATGEDALALGILWYLFPDEGHNGDGRHTSYLQRPDLALRDPEVHAALAALVAHGRRSVAAVEKERILPAATRYFSACVAAHGRPSERAEHRAAWFAQGLRKMAAAEIVFFDPDNGIETPALDKRGMKAGKYAFWSEIEAAWAAGKSLVVYNHLNRTAPASAQTERLHEQFEAKLSGAAVMPLLFRRGSCRHLWVIAQPAHRRGLEAKITAFLRRGWSADTDLFELGPARLTSGAQR